jgi:4-hydroxybenzoate polyprenyltransferase
MGDLKTKVVAWYQVTRPALTLLGVLASLALLKWTGQLGADPTRSVLIVLLVFSANLTWNIYAELRDRKLDRIANPKRPLPSGQLSSMTVYMVWAVLLWFSLVVNIVLMMRYGSVYAIGFLGHWAAFTYVGGRKDFIGNFLMGVAYGVAAFISAYPQYLLFSSAFLFWSFGYNIIQQSQKFEGEQGVGILTVPIQFGDMSMLFITELILTCSLIQYIWLFTETHYIPILMFTACNIMTSLAAYSMVNPNRKALCQYLRKIQKHVLIASFAAMFLF